MTALLKTAENHCRDQGRRLTDPRREVLHIIAHAKKPMRAYDILAAMPEDTKPPTVYRALEFWRQEGFIHHIKSLNAYAVCRTGHRHQGSQHMICETCGEVEEIDLCHLPPALHAPLHAAGFTLSRWSAELHGNCRHCRSQR